MILLVWYLDFLSHIAETSGLSKIDNLFERFIFAVLIAAFFVFTLVICIHVTARSLAHLTEYIGETIAQGARTDSLRTIENHTASISGVLRRVAFSQIRTVHQNLVPERQTLPSATPNIWKKGIRMLARLLVLCTSMLVAAVRLVGQLTFSVPGVIVVVLAISLAVPNAMRQLVTMLENFVNNLFTASVSLGTLIAATSASLAIVVIIAKLSRSDRAFSVRQLRQQRDLEAIEMLYEFLPIASRLAHAIDDHIDDTVDFFKIERFRFQRWEPDFHSDDSGRPLGDTDHIQCTTECLSFEHAEKSVACYFPDLKNALEALNQAEPLRLAMYERRLEFMRLFRFSRAWECYVYFVIFSPRIGFGVSSTERMFGVPGNNEWYEHRIEYQHHKLKELKHQALSGHFGHAELRRMRIEPQKSEQRLFDDVWAMCRASRQLHQFVGFGEKLMRNGSVKSAVARITG